MVDFCLLPLAYLKWSNFVSLSGQSKIIVQFALSSGSGHISSGEALSIYLIN
jgi:hypothetical protein